ncbi:uncharacterized protein LOC126771774 [Nymphalis io]|uniref:uncharacterized protein LOC126771774 n=1 Tax=Inachis io TaxID=171585 RepID=UPI002166F17C|nr:uncharacterized protein LOC126771774 [Nymphalis io]
MLCHFLVIVSVLVSVAGHGRVLEPPSRASMWRYGFQTKPNYDDDGLNCGGFYRQYNINRGKCGICGDPYDMKKPRTHEIGGTYGQGIIVAQFRAGQVFTAIVEITAFHRGYWYFKICPNSNRNDQSCFDKYPVELKSGGFKYYPPKSGLHKVDYRLPEGLFCDHCVLQWRYVAGNNWGSCGNGTGALGCGNQETFGACSDISISAPNYIQNGPFPVHLAYLNDVDKGLLDLLRKITPRHVKKKSPMSNKNKKNHRKPRNKDTKHSKRKKFWQPET